jgi:NADPH:quinone reductase-like Zn-dependent oxidoreductase
MKAIVLTKYGPPSVLQLREVEKPTPGAGQVLVRVHAAAANAGDWHVMRADPFVMRFYSGLLRPRTRILGVDVAGRVEALGREARKFAPGEEVFGDLSGSGFGAFAEYVCVDEDALVSKPKNLTAEQAAAVPSAALTALQGLRDHGRVAPGSKVLVNGASGGVGTFAVQIAKALGAEVTGVCSTANVDIVRSLGADHVIDYKNEDFTDNGCRYDLIFDAAAYRPMSDHRRSLEPRGTYLHVGGSGRQYMQVMFVGPWLSRKGGQTFRTFLKKPHQKDLRAVKELLVAGKIRPVIDRRFPLSEVPQAIGYLEEGHTRGKVVITVAPDV